MGVLIVIIGDSLIEVPKTEISVMVVMLSMSMTMMAVRLFLRFFD